MSAPALRNSEASMYEIQSKGRDPLLFLDAYKAGEAFYSVRRDELPKAVRYDHIAGGDRIPINAAMTAKSPSGHEHLFLDADEKFRAGYEAARERMPQKAIPLQDMQQPSTQATKGQTIPEQKQRPITYNMPPGSSAQIDGKTVASVIVKPMSHDSISVSALDANGQVIKKEGDIYPRDVEKVFGKDIANAVLVKDVQPQASPTSTQPSEKGPTVSDEKTIYRLEAKGQAPQSFTDAKEAGKAFYNTPVDDMAKLTRLDPGNKEYTLAAETRRSLDRGGREHVLLDVDKDFRAGYEAVKQQAPDKALNVREPLARPDGYTVPGPKPAVETQKVVNTIDLSSVPAPEKTPAAKPAQETQTTPREQLRASLEQRFEVASIGTMLKPADEYRFKGEGPLRIAFTDHGKQISTSLDTKEVVKGMADLAQAKGWREINVNGTPEFKRSMWTEGNLRGIHVAGYSPSKEDHERLKAARAELAQQQQPLKPQQEAAREHPKNTVETGPTRQQEKQHVQAAATAKGTAQAKEAALAQGSTRAQYLMAAKTVLTEQGVDAKTIDKAMQSLGTKLDAMLAAGKTLPTLHVFDRAAPSLAPVPTITVQPNMQPGREVAAPGR
jgi:hypothetical protein